MPLSPGRDHQLAGFEDFTPISGEVEGRGGSGLLGSKLRIPSSSSSKWASGSSSHQGQEARTRLGVWNSVVHIKIFYSFFPPGLFPAPRGETEAVKH